MSLTSLPTSHARFIAARLRPNEDVISAIRQIIINHQLQSAFIAGCVGSLTDVVLRFAGRDELHKMTGKFEIVSLIGTLDSKSEHLHLAISDENGMMCGGHMLQGCTVRTTLELIIGELEQTVFERQYCQYSGYDELVISQRTTI